VRVPAESSSEWLSCNLSGGTRPRGAAQEPPGRVPLRQPEGTLSNYLYRCAVAASTAEGDEALAKNAADLLERLLGTRVGRTAEDAVPDTGEISKVFQAMLRTK
jgi:hypothetical protein